ncbi:MAG: hypothetical protein ACYTFI_14700, partial [Planctomycetota bacterium]
MRFGGSSLRVCEWRATRPGALVEGPTMNPARGALSAALAVGLMVSVGAPARGQCLAHEHDVLTEDELPAYDAFGLAVAMDGDVAVIGDL